MLVVHVRWMGGGSGGCCACTANAACVADDPRWQLRRLLAEHTLRAEGHLTGRTTAARR